MQEQSQAERNKNGTEKNSNKKNVNMYVSTKNYNKWEVHNFGLA